MRFRNKSTLCRRTAEHILKSDKLALANKTASANCSGGANALSSTPRLVRGLMKLAKQDANCGTMLGINDIPVGRKGRLDDVPHLPI